MMTTAKAVAVSAAMAVLALLVACDHNTHPGQHCVARHDQQEYDPPIYVKVGTMMVPVGGGMRTVRVCDSWAPNGATSGGGQ